MKYIGTAIVYVAFFALIGLALWITKNIWVLIFLVLIPDLKSKNNE